MVNKNTKPTPPQFSEQDVKPMAKQLYGLDLVSVKPLDSELDLNFYLQEKTGGEFVFKIAHSQLQRDELEAQHQAMKHMTRHLKTLKCPGVCQTLKGEEIASVKSPSGTTHLVRMVTFLPGVVFAELKDHPPELLKNLGQALGEMSKAFANFHHPALHRYYRWDLKNIPDLEIYAGYIQNLPEQRLVKYFLQQFKTFVVPVFPKLRQSIIHNDVNDYNLLVDADGKTLTITGIIDFGDMVYSYTVGELAIAIAYGIHGKPDLLETAARIVGSYHKVFPLEELELEVLFHLICARLCATLLISAYQLKLDPGNEYLKISVEPAREALEKMMQINPDHAAHVFRKACGLSTVPGSAGLPPGKILETREKHMGRNMSVSYRKPLKIVRGAMQYLYDHTGRAYLDTVNNVCHVGHCHPRVVEAAQKQMAVLNTNTRYLHDHIVEYAQRLCDLLPEPLSVCYFVNSGSEANELALRLARTHTQNTDFIVIDHAYHGNTNDIIEISPYKFDGPGGTGAPPHVHKVMIPDVFRGPYKSNHPGVGEKYALDLQRVIDEMKIKNKKPAAFIHEPLMSVAGQIVLPKNYLKQAYQYAREAGAVCIADEVQVGLGRVGTHMWAFETQDVVPDIVTMGKPIGNGHPLAAVVTTPEIADSFNNGMEYFNTFGGNPVSCAVGLAVLDVIRDEKLQENALQVGEYMKAGLKRLMDKHLLIGDVRGLGLFLGIELVLDRETLEPAKEQAYDIAERMKEQGILISIDGPLYNVIKIKPPLVFTEANADEYIGTLDKILGSI
ncbi:MAG: aminotransferase class III-fold pyridoxal phosphate-dependent enzyme [Candidatus Aminicenantes bacterium]|jgi:4-aminobutyrate aminotransferase-like enzyme/Ser/Thr protein kinase RdoA (MazF antagonist)